jgi:signal transduction histidine kinase
MADLFSHRHTGRDLGAWPMLVLLFLVVLAAVACVLWFMREAMRNEHMAMREKLTDAYRGHLFFLQTRAAEKWEGQMRQIGHPDPGPGHFAACATGRWADSAICLDAQGRIVYPRRAQKPEKAAADNDALQSQLRSLVQSGKTEEAIRYVLEKFSVADLKLDSHGRSMAANAEFLALELLGDRKNPEYRLIAQRLRQRINNYTTNEIPSVQRRFIMHGMQRLDPEEAFPTLAAEDLAERYLETNPVLPNEATLHKADRSEIWAAAAPGRRVIALYTTENLRTRLTETLLDSSSPKGVKVTAVYPNDEPTTDSALVSIPLGSAFPGWRLSLLLDDQGLFYTESERRVARYLAVGCLASAAMAMLAVFLARNFGRQVELTRLKNDLVATVSHELKTPLTSMRAIIDTLLDAKTLDEKTTREYLHLVATENARLSRLIENFLTFSRLERNKFTFEWNRVRPEQIVANALAAMGERVRAPRCTLEVRTEDNLPSIHADADALATALLNLLDNAWKYSGDDKHIVLHTEAFGNGLKKVRFAVKDHGIGLSPREVGRIFRRFYQADRRLSRTAGGCGLGLSIVQSIVDAHRGSVHVASEPNCGSTFTIEIPAIPSES